MSPQAVWGAATATVGGNGPGLASTPLADGLLAAREWVGLTVGSLWLALFLVLLAAAVKLAKEFRRNGFRVLGIFAGNEADGAHDAHNSLSKFRELHARGTLSDEEYRTIKTKLASELQAERVAADSSADDRSADGRAAAARPENDATLPTFDPTSPTPAPAELAASKLPTTSAPAADAAGAAVDQTTSDQSDKQG
ncbi:MAG: SHOCT domain-containing protein [Planctomycetota bacterium]